MCMCFQDVFTWGVCVMYDAFVMCVMCVMCLHGV